MERPMTATVYTFRSKAELRQAEFDAKLDARRYDVQVDGETLGTLAQAAKHLGVSEFDLLAEAIRIHCKAASDAYRANWKPGQGI